MAEIGKGSDGVIASMAVDVLSWDALAATAWVELHFESFSLGKRRVDEATLMMLTGTADEPGELVGRRFMRDIV